MDVSGGGAPTAFALKDTAPNETNSWFSLEDEELFSGGAAKQAGHFRLRHRATQKYLTVRPRPPVAGDETTEDHGTLSLTDARNSAAVFTFRPFGVAEGASLTDGSVHKVDYHINSTGTSEKWSMAEHICDESCGSLHFDDYSSMLVGVDEGRVRDSDLFALMKVDKQPSRDLTRVLATRSRLLDWLRKLEDQVAASPQQKDELNKILEEARTFCEDRGEQTSRQLMMAQQRITDLLVLLTQLPFVHPHYGRQCDMCAREGVPILGVRVDLIRTTETEDKAAAEETVLSLCNICYKLGCYDGNGADDVVKYTMNPETDIIQSVDPPRLVHAGVMCDGCGAYPISGLRRECSVCPRFDLCETCYSEKKEKIGPHRPDEHAMYIISELDADRELQEVHDVACYVCKTKEGHMLECTECQSHHLCFACFNGSKEAVRKHRNLHPFIRKLGTIQNASDHHGEHLKEEAALGRLVRAIADNDVAEFSNNLDEGYHHDQCKVNTTDPMHWISYWGRSTFADQVLDKVTGEKSYNGAYLGVTNETRQNFLTVACEQGNLEMINILLALHLENPSVTKEDDFGMSPLGYAAYEGRLEVLKVLVGYCETEPTLQMAIVPLKPTQQAVLKAFAGRRRDFRACVKYLKDQSMSPVEGLSLGNGGGADDEKVALLFGKYDKDKDGFLDWGEYGKLCGDGDGDGKPIMPRHAFGQYCSQFGIDIEKGGISVDDLTKLYSIGRQAQLNLQRHWKALAPLYADSKALLKADSTVFRPVQTKNVDLTLESSEGLALKAVRVTAPYDDATDVCGLWQLSDPNGLHSYTMLVEASAPEAKPVTYLNGDFAITDQPEMAQLLDQKLLQPLKCQSGHTLTGFTTSHDGFGCDVCHRRVSEGTYMFGSMNVTGMHVTVVEICRCRKFL
jgi:hypothetical protein